MRPGIHLLFHVLCISVLSFVGPAYSQTQADNENDKTDLNQTESDRPLFFMAGDFEKAVQASKDQGKPMLIKGVGQIVDPVGAKSIDKGEC